MRAKNKKKKKKKGRGKNKKFKHFSVLKLFYRVILQQLNTIQKVFFQRFKKLNVKEKKGKKKGE